MASGTLAPIPKCRKLSREDSANYRLVALSSALGKLSDYVMLELDGEKLATSEHQYAYKKGFSATQCTFNFIETIKYYNYNDTTVYLILLDASKAFDRIHYGQLFNMLLERRMHPCLIRFLLSSYLCQRLNVKWRHFCTSPFATSNGTKQGGVISPILFIIFVDGLFVRLEERGVGCYLGNRFAGVGGYADDVSLLAPTLEAARVMIAVCCEYAAEFHIIFNQGKTKLLVFRCASDSSLPEQSITVGLSTVSECCSELHLGHVLCPASLDKSLVTDAIGKYWGFYNSMVSDFGSTHPFIQCKLFKSYCCSFYGSPLWDLSQYAESIATAWRKGLKCIWDVPRETHREVVALLSDTVPIQLSLYKRLCQFVKTALTGPSCNTGFVMRVARLNPTSSFCKNMNLLCYLFDIDMDYLYTYSVPNLKGRWQAATEPLTDGVCALHELLNAKFFNCIDEGFDEEDVDGLIHMLAAG